ncbi:MAG TPA: HTH domain-containing protein [Thermococcaceae archaeon]|nr:HTH domain-containing protein [Thermococcaceae archaeon]
MLVFIECEAVSVEGCLRELKEKAKILENMPGSIEKAKIELSFGAFMGIRMALNIDPTKIAEKYIIAEYTSGKDIIKRLQEEMQKKIRDTEVIDFTFGTYTMPVTRRKYAVGIAVVNKPKEKENFQNLSIEERRAILRKALELFGWNPKALNISEIARLFNVSRDSIYNDIEQILKERD